jgi:hypothetical protein
MPLPPVHLQPKLSQLPGADIAFVGREAPGTVSILAHPSPIPVSSKRRCQFL